VQCCQGLDAADANEVAAVIEAPSDGAGKIYSPWSISGRQIGSVAQGLIDVPPARAKNSSAQERSGDTVDFFPTPRTRQRIGPVAAQQKGSGPDTPSIPWAGLSVGRAQLSSGPFLFVSLIPSLNFPSHARPEVEA